jgi:hypothetical protein
LPKLTLAGESVIVVVAAVPVPLSATLAGEFGALLTIETAPLALPAACGAYCTVIFPLCPGVKVIGRVIPLTLNPAPVAAAWDIVKFALPLFLICIVCELVFPVSTEPKLALPGVTLIPAWTPAPVTASVAFTPSLFVTMMLPAVAPLVVGAYLTVNTAFCKGKSVNGVATPLTETPEPLAAT